MRKSQNSLQRVFHKRNHYKFHCIRFQMPIDIEYYLHQHPGLFIVNLKKDYSFTIITMFSNAVLYPSIPGRLTTRVQPLCSLTIGVVAETGELLIRPLSLLGVSVPFTRISQDESAPTINVLIQQHPVYLHNTLWKKLGNLV